MTVETSDVAQAPLLAGEWKIDALHSQVLVTVRHMAVASLRAKFPKVTGALIVDAGNPLESRCHVEIDATSVTTGHSDQEDFMRSEAWLDAANHPTITFDSREIRQASEQSYVMNGDLTLRGVTRPVSIPFEFHGVIADRWGLRTGFTSQVTLDRTDFGITWDPRYEWGPLAGRELNISLDIEFVRPDESLAAAPLG